MAGSRTWDTHFKIFVKENGVLESRHWGRRKDLVNLEVEKGIIGELNSTGGGMKNNEVVTETSV